MLTRRPFAAGYATSTIVALTIGLAACSPAQPSITDTASATSSQDYAIAFSECLREQGIAVADESGGDVIGAAQDQDAMLRAAAACEDKLGPAPAGTQDDAGQGSETDYVAIAECLRGKGIAVEDPAPGQALSLPMDAPREVLRACTEAGATP